MFLTLLSALLLSWACTARPLLEPQPRGAVSLAVRATGGQIRGRVMNTTQEPLLYTPLYLERYNVWYSRWDVVRLASSVEARLSPGAQADEYLVYADERLREPGYYRVCVGSLPRSAWSLLGALTKRYDTLRPRPRPDWPVTCAALWEGE